MSDKEIANTLNDVLEYLHDSCNGYKECAKEISNKELQELFEKLAVDREQMIGELEKEVAVAGEEPAKYGSVLGVMHRLFVDLKSLLTGGDAEAIINEIKRGEHMLITHYKAAIEDENLSASLQSLLTRQLDKIQENLNEVIFSGSEVT